MFEELTSILPALDRASYGEWIIDRENDGLPEHPIHFPYVNYDLVVDRLIDSVYRFADQHKGKWN